MQLLTSITGSLLYLAFIVNCQASTYKLVAANLIFNCLKVQANPSGNFSQMYRHNSKGCWTFAIQDHGWQGSDSTAEALKVTQVVCSHHFTEKISLSDF